jgi:hypothetical protein
MKLKLFVAGIIGAMLVGIPALVMAQDQQQANSTTETMEVRKSIEETRKKLINRTHEKFDSAREKRLIRSCANAQLKIAKISQQNKQRRDNRARLYTNVINVIDKFVNRLNDDGLDISQLETNVTQLKSMAAQVSLMWDDYSEELTAITNAKGCSDNPQEFHDSLEAAKDSLEAVHDYIKEIKTFINGNLKQSLLSIKEQISDSKVEE